MTRLSPDEKVSAEINLKIKRKKIMKSNIYASE
jgi:hypothetical protein